MDTVGDKAVPSGDTTPPAPEISPPTPEKKKRDRIRYSCTHCREKKLKCNRQMPCEQCEKRNLSATCRFVPYEKPNEGFPNIRIPTNLNRTAPVSRPRHQQQPDLTLQTRLKHLERLVQVLKSQRRETPGESQDPDNLPLEFIRHTEKATLRAGDQRYVDTAHWESLLDDIAVLTRDLTTYDEGEATREESGVSAVQGPVLLLGGFPHLTVIELVSILPPRTTVDRLVARFFEAKEPSWAMFHIPTFMKEYKKFWDNPFDAHYTWFGLLFVMCCHATLYYLLANEEIPGALGDPQLVFDELRTRAAQCLTLADYTKPGPYKIQAMFLYFGAEYLRRNESILGTSTLLAITIRLAMHSGLHRDPKHYPRMPAYEGEMRRRLWVLLRGVDLIVSFQFGVPSNIHRGGYDTEPPRNLHDEDFDESSTRLPPSRPETERTVALMPIVRGRMLEVFDDIMTAINVHKPASYTEIMQVHCRLGEVHDSLPDILKYRPFSQSLVDPVELLMHRYWLELQYHKSRAVLHRKYHCLARRDSRFGFSRQICLDAATQILKHQYDIHLEMQMGGRLAKDRWFMNSFGVHDFLLASMILCLELAFLRAKEKYPGMTDIALREFDADTSPDILSVSQLTEILGTSRLIWQATSKQSAEANRAFKIISRMLAISYNAQVDSSPESGSQAEWSMAPPFHFGADTGSNIASSTSSLSTPGSRAVGWTPTNGAAPLNEPLPASWPFDVPALSPQDLPPMESLEGWVDAGLTKDWSLWDNQIQDPSLESSQMAWDTFFRFNNI